MTIITTVNTTDKQSTVIAIMIWYDMKSYIPFVSLIYLIEDVVKLSSDSSIVCPSVGENMVLRKKKKRITKWAKIMLIKLFKYQQNIFLFFVFWFFFSFYFSEHFSLLVQFNKSIIKQNEMNGNTFKYDQLLSYFISLSLQFSKKKTIRNTAF